MPKLLASTVAMVGCIGLAPAWAFNANEHRKIGDEALKLAVKQFSQRHPRASAGLFAPRHRLRRNDLKTPPPPASVPPSAVMFGSRLAISSRFMAITSLRSAT